MTDDDLAGAIYGMPTNPLPPRDGLASIPTGAAAADRPSVIITDPQYLAAMEKALRRPGPPILSRVDLMVIEARATGRICALLGV